MLDSIAKRLFGTANERLVKGFVQPVAAINALEPELEKLSDESLRARTDELRRRLAAGEELDDILADAFATVREAAKRALGERPFDVQLMGGIVLHRGMIAEMKTGEGKTLVATMPVYLNALRGEGVHVVTVNDYLARRDADWMGKIYTRLGLTVGCIVHGLSDEERRAAYAADVTYGTNNEFGFDYLRDNMKFEIAAMVQRPFNYGIVDEVDSILVDEARTPLIISGPARIHRNSTSRRTNISHGSSRVIMRSTIRRAPWCSPMRASSTWSRCSPRPARSRTRAFTITRTSRSCITSIRRSVRTSCSPATPTT